MLQFLRNKAQSIFIQAIVVIIALVFIFWGVGTNLMNNREAALVINDEEISFQDFQVAYDRAYANLRDQFGDSIPQALLESLGIKDQVANQLIQEALLRQGAAKMGLDISREEIQETVKDMGQFQDNGNFSLDKYKEILAANNYSPRKFEESMKVDMMVQKASLAITNFAATATDFEIADLHKLEKSTVAVRYVKISPSDYRKNISPSDADLAAWYATVQDNYKTAPQVKLKYLDFSYTAVGKKVTIDDSALQTYYQDHLAQYSTPEKRKARHILLKADEKSPADVRESQKKKAQDVLELARKGSDFSELAQQYSEDSSSTQGGDLGLFPRGQMVQAFDDAVFALKVGELSDVVETGFGYHIILVDEIVAATTQPFDSVRESILKQLQIEQARPLAFQVANASYEGIIAAGSMQAYLDAHAEIEVLQTDFFEKSNPPAAVGNDEKFLQAAFALKEGELSSLIETAGGYAILYAEAVKQPAVPDLVDVKAVVLQDYTAAKAEEAAKEAATALVQQAKDDSTLSAAAAKTGIPVHDSGYLGRNRQDSTASLPAELVEAAFKLSALAPLSPEPAQVDGDFYVLEFVGQKLPETPLTENEKEQYTGAVIQFKQQQILSAWLKNQRQKAKIFTHKSL